MSDRHSRVPAPRWAAMLVRAVLAVALGVVVTFSQEHSAGLGIVGFGIWAVAQAVLVGAAGWVLRRSSVGGALAITQAVLGALTGVVALLALSGGISTLLVSVSAFGVITGALEIYRSRRADDRMEETRDNTAVGVMSVLLGLVFFVIPGDPVLAVGLLGAYAVIVGVWLAIGAFSLRGFRAVQPAAGTAEGGSR